MRECARVLAARLPVCCSSHSKGEEGPLHSLKKKKQASIFLILAAIPCASLLSFFFAVATAVLREIGLRLALVKVLLFASGLESGDWT